MGGGGGGGGTAGQPPEVLLFPLPPRGGGGGGGPVGGGEGGGPGGGEGFVPAAAGPSKKGEAGGFRPPLHPQEFVVPSSAAKQRREWPTLPIKAPKQTIAIAAPRTNDGERPVDSRAMTDLSPDEDGFRLRFSSGGVVENGQRIGTATG